MLVKYLCIYRELHEEAGIVSDDLKEVGVLMFEFQNDPQLLEVHVFVSWNYTGDVTESDGKSTIMMFLRS